MSDERDGRIRNNALGQSRHNHARYTRQFQLERVRTIASLSALLVVEGIIRGRATCARFLHTYAERAAHDCLSKSCIAHH